ncbi:MAG TPA: hypothetical protein PLR18_01615 [bacterium]|nr:hypothetical protein [bacterium]
MHAGVIGTFFSFPPGWLRWDSHSLIYDQTYKIVKKVEPNFSNFIKLKDVYKYDGGYGPDRFWCRGERSTSEAYYNPSNGEGGALKQVAEHYRMTVARAARNLTWGKEFTWMSHFVVDALSPAHHFGQKRKTKKKYRDWDDPYFNYLTQMRSFKNKHPLFEGLTNFWQVFSGRTDAYFEKLEQVNGANIEIFMLNMIYKVREMKLYEEFVEKGWSRELWQKIKIKLLPQIEYALAAVWWSLMKEVEEERKRITN